MIQIAITAILLKISSFELKIQQIAKTFIPNFVSLFSTIESFF